MGKIVNDKSTVTYGVSKQKAQGTIKSNILISSGS